MSEERKTYRERLEEHLGPAGEGETRLFDLDINELISSIKEALKTNHSCSAWTFEHTEEEISTLNRLLTKEGIIHYHDHIMDAFLCFGSQEDMESFREYVRKEMEKQ